MHKIMSFISHILVITCFFVLVVLPDSHAQCISDFTLQSSACQIESIEILDNDIDLDWDFCSVDIDSDPSFLFENIMYIYFPFVAIHQLIIAEEIGKSRKGNH